MSERTPLLHYRLSNSVNESENRPSPAGVAAAQSPAVSRRKTANNQPPKLSTFFGVVIPTLLSMFSVVVFLRIGFVVGQAGLYQAIGMFLVAYFIISMTVLSVCAISTNGALDAGGAYYMISRALGPEFGGSIGIMFFFANVCGSALYVLGLVEAVIATFGIPEDTTAVARTASQVLPQGYWWSLLYGTVILLLCLLVCLVGAHIYAKATFLIFIIVIVVLATIFISFFAVSPRQVLLPPSPPNTSSPSSANFTGFKLDTLLANLEAGYTVDYTTGIQMTFATVFAVMFNGCTGIMAGSNMSGDLKNPSYSIPRGTITAVIFTFIIYNLLSVLVACSCDRILLQRDYSFLRDINVWHPLVTIGVYSSTLSAAMSNLIGASRILYALARDDLFGKALSPAKRTSRSGNPWTSVLISWFLVQLVLFSGKLNTIASIVTIFFLLVYAAVDLACLALEWASAPNFRPTFRYFTWHTCVLGILGCAVMMFLINAIYASASIAFMLLLLLLIHYLSPTSSWGYISQALIFHQVRKYLLMLDVRKDHVKFWRPQVLLMVANPRGSTSLITFINDIKKSGLYVLGHVELGDLDLLPSDPLQSRYDSWLSLVDHLNIKAFVNLTLASSVRHGVQHLLFISGLGGMRPNTLVLGFYDDCSPEDKLLDPAEVTGNSADARPAAGPRGPADLRLPLSAGRGGDGQGRGQGAGPAGVRGGDRRRGEDAEERGAGALLLPLRPGGGAGAARRGGRALRGRVAAQPAPPRQQQLRGHLQPLPAAAGLRAQHGAGLAARPTPPLPVRGDGAEPARLGGEAAPAAEGPAHPGRHPHRALGPGGSAALAAAGRGRQGRQERGGRGRGEGRGGGGGGGRLRQQLPQQHHPSVGRVPARGQRAAAGAVQPPPAVRFLYLPRPPADTRRYSAYLRQLDLLTRDLGPTLLIHGVTPVITTDL
ncbi:hypothetical protein ANANG_G00234610 [Anguilla anguilla]|uniref:Solute carrier family 12 member 9 n=1 Tax=Anguilla anguilla TaxID=7936 RepID=A0A9D3LTZ8_ANGAN|nr:hypothetical protein ANANG_G00234610 [Anguilla anguilla]